MEHPGTARRSADPPHASSRGRLRRSALHAAELRRTGPRSLRAAPREGSARRLGPGAPAGLERRRLGRPAALSEPQRRLPLSRAPAPLAPLLPGGDAPVPGPSLDPGRARDARAAFRARRVAARGVGRRRDLRLFRGDGVGSLLPRDGARGGAPAVDSLGRRPHRSQPAPEGGRDRPRGRAALSRRRRLRDGDRRGRFGRVDRARSRGGPPAARARRARRRRRPGRRARGAAGRRDRSSCRRPGAR